MAEKYANAFATTLGAAIVSTSATTITTSVAAPTALQSGEFRVIIDSEILRVTAGQTGTSWTVERGVEGTTAATHLDAAPVTHILTAASLSSVTEFVRDFSRDGTLVVVTGTAKAYVPSHATLVSVVATVGTAPTGASVIVDVNRNGSTVFTTQANRPTIAVGETMSSVAVPNTTGWSAGDWVSVDIDQIGSTLAGEDLTVSLYFQKAASSSPLVLDPFTDTPGVTLQAHTGANGVVWTRHPSSAANDVLISSVNRIRAGTASVVLLYYASGAPATAEYDVTATIQALSFVATDASAVTGRMDPTANTLYGARYVVASTQWQLFKIVDGVLTDLGLSSQTITVGQDYTLKLQIRNATKKLFVDGVEILSSADNTITAAGRAGIRMFCSSSNDVAGVQLDNFTATSP